MSDRSSALWAVMGPTASGKSALAMQLCETVGGELITVDSAQVFVGLDVGTAKPTLAEQARLPHHLINLISPSTQWSAADFCRAADTAIADVRSRGRVPILCGGTGLWMRALVRGIFEAPDIDADLRQQIREDLASLGPEAMHAELAKVDPDAAARIETRDPQRIGRALEVYRQTGTPISALQAKHRFQERRYNLVGVALRWPREELRARIALRTERMFDQGIVAETESCLASGVAPDSPGLSIIGYRDTVRLIQGDIDRAEAIRATTVATRRYAKRQRNWFNGEPDVHWVDHTLSATEVLEHLRQRSALPA